MLVVPAKPIRIVWRDGFFLYLCSKINNKYLDMTQGEAVIKALEDLGGKASLRQIYDLAQRYATFGTQTPEDSIRTILQRSPKAKQKVEALITPTATFERLSNMYMDASRNKDKDDRKEVCNILNKIQSRLNLTVSAELYNRIVSFDKDIPLSKINVDGNNNGVVSESIGINLSPDWQKELVNGLLGNNLLNNGNSNQG